MEHRARVVPRTARVCRPGAAVTAPVPPLLIVRRSAPSGHASAHSEISRASPECHQTAFELLMKLVLVWSCAGPRQFGNVVSGVRAVEGQWSAPLQKTNFYLVCSLSTALAVPYTEAQPKRLCNDQLDQT